jgi:hypothetical protein
MSKLEVMEMNRAARVILGVLPLLAACYTQAPLHTPVPVPDQRIVAQVTDTGRVTMANTLGPGAQEVEGIVSGADAASWDLRMVRVNYRGGSSVLWNNELVRFPRSALTDATERRFSKVRSWLVAGLLTSSAFLAARFLGVIGGGGDEEKPPPPPN